METERDDNLKKLVGWTIASKCLPIFEVCDLEMLKAKFNTVIHYITFQSATNKPRM